MSVKTVYWFFVTAMLIKKIKVNVLRGQVLVSLHILTQVTVSLHCLPLLISLRLEPKLSGSEEGSKLTCRVLPLHELS